jgi:hypothetical protein
MVMSAGFEALADRLGQRFTALSMQFDEQVLSQRICGGDAYCTVGFAIEAGGLRDLVKTFREDRGLWTDFLSAIRAHRPDRHWATLVEFVYEIGNLEGQLRMLETYRGSPYPDERARLSRRLNDLDGEIAIRHVLADRRNLAGRVCAAAGIPLIDGLTMRGLTFTLAVDGDLLRAFTSLVESPEPSQGNSLSRNFG